MNKRSRNRLIVVTVVVVLIIGVIVVLSFLQGRPSYYKRIREIQADESLRGVSVRVGGTVVKDSIERDEKGIHFTLADGKARLRVNYEGVVPQTFGADVQVLAEGIYQANGELDAAKLITKCPTKYKAKVKPEK